MLYLNRCCLLTFLFILVKVTSQTHPTYQIDVSYKTRNSIYSNIVLDKNGYHWYATVDALVRSDGEERTIIPLKFTDNNVKGLYEYNSKRGIKGVRTYEDKYDNLGIDASQNLYMTSHRGLFVIDSLGKNVQLIQYKLPESDKITPLASLIVNENVVYVADKLGYFFKVTNGKLKLLGKVNEEFTADARLKVDALGQIILIYHKSIYVYKDNKLQLVKKNCFPNSESIISLLRVKDVPNFFKDEGNYHFNGKSFKYIYLPEIGEYCLEIPFDKLLLNKTLDPNYRIAFNSEEHPGLLFGKFDSDGKGKITLRPIEGVNKFEGINDLTFDKKKNVLWLNKRNSIIKIKILKNNFVSYLKDAPRKNVSCRAIHPTKDGGVYVNSYSGIFELKKDSAKLIDGISIYTMIRENDSTFLAVTEGQRAAKFNESQKTISKFHINHLNSIVEQRDSLTYWMGGRHGISIFDKKLGNTIAHNKLNDKVDLTNYSINDILLAKNKEIVWFATDRGAFKYNLKTKEVTIYTVATKGITSNVVFDIHESDDGTIWLATDHGVNKILANGKLEKLTKKNGLYNETVYAILEAKNNLWLSTHNGISYVNLKTNKVNSFFVSEEPNDNEFNKKSALKLNDSILYFGSVNGLYKFNVNEILRNEYSQPKIYTKEIIFFDEESNKTIQKYDLYNKLDQIELAYNNNSFELKVGLSNFFNPENNQYRYTINGLSNQWIDNQNATTIRVYGIPPGNYTLKVVGVNDYGETSENVLTIPIKAHQIFYKTSLFIIVTIVTILLLIFLGIFNSINKKKEETKVKAGIHALKLKLLRSQLNPHFIFNIINNLQSDLVLKNEVDANEYINSFSKLLRITMDMIDYDTHTLEKELQYLKSYINLQKLRLDNNLEYKIKVELKGSKAENVLIPCMLLQPIVENAIIHGLEPKDKNKMLLLNFILTGNELIVVIEDNGVGRSKSKNSTGKKDYKVHALGMLVNKITTINQMNNKKTVQMKTIDLMDNGKKAGTKVVFIITTKEER